jgi:hypothetical protein
MRVGVCCLIVLLATTPAFAQDQDAQAQSHEGRGGLFWTGLALGVAGVATSVLGVTAFRVDDTSTGNAPASSYQACLAQRVDPIYASNNCDALKGKNRPMLWGGVAAGVLGAALMIRGTSTSAEISQHAVRVFHTVRF